MGNQKIRRIKSSPPLFQIGDHYVLVGRDSLGVNGMEVASCRLLEKLFRQETATLAFRVARLTHGHPLAVFPRVEFTMALRSILSGKRKVPRNLTDPDLLALAAGKYGIGDYLEWRGLKTDELPATTGLFQVFEDLLGMQQGASWSSLPGFEEGILRVVKPKRGSRYGRGYCRGTAWG